jgi:hypothetical protein
MNPPPAIPIYTVGYKSKNLMVTHDSGIRERIRNWTGVFRQAEVIEVKKSNRKPGFLVYCGRPGRI